VFADADVQSTLKQVVAPHVGTFDIRVYDPVDAAAPGESKRLRTETQRRQLSTPVSNPWLRWIKRSLNRRSADVVHFLCHCYLSGDEGALAVAESPTRNTDPDSARFIWADELAAFVNDVGAWSVAFTSPAENYSLTGMRMLQDQIARLRPGPCLVHDMAEPAAAGALGDAYRFLYLSDWHPAPRSSAIALYCHPRRQSVHQRVDEVSERVLRDVTLKGRLSDDLLSNEEHGWLSSAQRVLEQSASTLMSSGSDEEASSRAGRREALQFVADTLAKYSSIGQASADASTDTESPTPGDVSKGKD